MKWEEIQQLDLTSVREKFKKRKGWWWNCWHDAKKTEQEYRLLLWTFYRNPKDTVAPWSIDVDDFWHEHILDTRKYTNDCQKIFGRFVNHNPHLPVGTPEHAAALERTKATIAEDEPTLRKRESALPEVLDLFCEVLDSIASCGSGCSSDSCGGDGCGGCGGCGD